MTPKIIKSSAKSTSSPAKKSPSKPNKEVPIPKSKQRDSLYCLAFDENFSFELYFYQKTDDDDGFTHGLAKYIRGNEDETHKDLDKCNFTEVLVRRSPGSNNNPLQNRKDTYQRKLFLRYPTEGRTDEKIRGEGLAAVKSFLMDSRFTKYPPSNIDTFDITDYNTNSPTPMDHYMMNKDIEAAIKQNLDASFLNNQFKSEYPEIAERLWTSKYPGEYGKTLGF